MIKVITLHIPWAEGESEKVLSTIQYSLLPQETIHERWQLFSDNYRKMHDRPIPLRCVEIYEEVCKWES